MEESHAVLRSRVKDLPATYDVIRYGPSESVCCRNVALSGTYCMYSTGRAEQKPMVRMEGKSGVELFRWNVRVVSLVATTPGRACELTYDEIPATVPGALANPSQYAAIPAMVAVK